MLIVKAGDLFESGCEALVNPVNTVGVMGAGLAHQFKKRFPPMFTEYHGLCRAGGLVIGGLHCWRNPSPPLWVINFPTKEHYRSPSKVEYIEKGLFALEAFVKEDGVKSLAIPALGCGLGGLKFGTVLALLQGFYQRLEEVEVMIYLPAGASEPSGRMNTH